MPGQEWRTFWDGTAGTTHLHEDAHTATVAFSDSQDRALGPYTFGLDWSHISGRMFPSPSGIPELAKAAGEIRDVLKGWKAPGNALRIHSYDGYEYDKRQQEWFEERQREHQTQQAAEEEQGEQPG